VDQSFTPRRFSLYTFSARFYRSRGRAVFDLAQRFALCARCDAEVGPVSCLNGFADRTLHARGNRDQWPVRLCYRQRTARKQQEGMADAQSRMYREVWNSRFEGRFILPVGADFRASQDDKSRGRENGKNAPKMCKAN